MDKKTIIYFVFLITLSLIYILDKYRFVIYLFLILQQGLIQPSKFWWTISDLLLDKHSIFDFSIEKYSNGIHYEYISSVKCKIVNDINEVKYLLENSPEKFIFGTLKINVLKYFMPNNVGITIDANLWRKRRDISEIILESSKPKNDRITSLQPIIIDYINSIGKFTTYESFLDLSSFMTKLLLFGHTDVSDSIFNLITPKNYINLTENISYVHDKWNKILKTTKIEDGSLISSLKEFGDISTHELIDHIPHWLFPIIKAITLSLPRCLLVDSLYEKKYNKVENIPTRNKILEISRLDNTVVSINKKSIETGEEFFIFMKMFLRNKKYFTNPHKYDPLRWNDKSLEYQMYSLMFSQGPQICPGKNLIIHLMVIMFDAIKPLFKSNKFVDVDDLPDSLNPFNLF